MSVIYLTPEKFSDNYLKVRAQSAVYMSSRPAAENICH